MSGQLTFDDIRCVARVNSIFISFRSLFESELEGRAGGYLCVVDRKGLPVFLDRLGDIPEEKLKQYYRNANEKAERLAYASHYSGHTLSRQSRDEKRERWIGAILGTEWIWSFSGFPEDCDEVFMVALALGYGDIAYPHACRLLRQGCYDESRLFKKVDSLLRTLAGIQ